MQEQGLPWLLEGFLAAAGERRNQTRGEGHPQLRLLGWSRGEALSSVAGNSMQEREKQRERERERERQREAGPGRIHKSDRQKKKKLTSKERFLYI